VWSPGIEQKSLSDFQKKSDVQLQRSGESDSVLLLVVRVFFYWKLQRGCCETWGAGVDIHTVDTRPSLFQFRNHFLVRFVPNELPLPCADHLISAWHLWYVTRERPTLKRFFVFVFFWQWCTHLFVFLGLYPSPPHLMVTPSTQSNLLPKQICFFHVETHKVSTSMRWVAHFTTQAMSWRGAFRTFIVHDPWTRSKTVRIWLKIE